MRKLLNDYHDEWSAFDTYGKLLSTYRDNPMINPKNELEEFYRDLQLLCLSVACSGKMPAAARKEESGVQYTYKSK